MKIFCSVCQKETKPVKLDFKNRNSNYECSKCRQKLFLEKDITQALTSSVIMKPFSSLVKKSYSTSEARVRRHGCTSDKKGNIIGAQWQDKYYGKGNRVVTFSGKEGSDKSRCTVCGDNLDGTSGKK